MATIDELERRVDTLAKRVVQLESEILLPRRTTAQTATPIATSPPFLHQSIAEHAAERWNKGRSEYGIGRWVGRHPLLEAMEELADCWNYCEAAGMLNEVAVKLRACYREIYLEAVKRQGYGFDLNRWQLP